eukprot:gnl/MRDRNA2_/MRDRNA2_34407_c0_seq1.p1 gnl/MRDRNA2_/MRDRNA2_34407_c0~~gnl/MRDRNA2_/MRDRNA2_34407_c0_seq1.p1  ORF type:complete len:385 (+),score=45.41 gnl/MRDRNA2_/MRDRNA2_34407_c0_seq1:135-1289(+)
MRAMAVLSRVHWMPVVVIVTALLVVVVAWTLADSIELKPRKSFWEAPDVDLEALRPLLEGVCNLGTLDQPQTVASLDIQQIGGFALPLPGGIRCPVVIRGLQNLGLWNTSVKSWDDLQYLESRTPAYVTVDVSQTGKFRYWDNTTAFADEVRRIGLLKEDYSKLTVSKRQFYQSLAAEGSENLGFVRYGGSLKTFAPSLDWELWNKVNRLIPTGRNQKVLLYLSSNGSFSTAHYDNFENVYVMIAGSKSVFLSPPNQSVLFSEYPTGHPHARQAQRHFGLPGRSRPDPMIGNVLVLEAILNAGDALFIPSGWFHHIIARSTSVSLALTALPEEHFVFEDWMDGQITQLLPFVQGTGKWQQRRLASALIIFIPALLEALTIYGAR